MYSITTLEEALKNGTIRIDLNGHSEREGQPDKERLLDYIRMLYELYSSGGKDFDGNDEGGAREWERWQGEDAFKVGRPLISIGCQHYCFNCGVEPYPYLKDSTTISLLEYKERQKVESICAMTGPKPCKTTIDVPSGELVFANFFHGIEDAPEGAQYARRWSLNAVVGRQNIANHLASQGFGYGQMGNTSVTVYNSLDDDRIVLFNPDPEHVREEVEYLQEEGEDIAPALKAQFDELVSFEKEGFKEAGTVHCEMWRWMCADKATLQKSGARESDNYEPFTVKVKPGKWEITPYYDLSGEDTMVASEMKWVDSVV